MPDELRDDTLAPVWWGRAEDDLRAAVLQVQADASGGDLADQRLRLALVPVELRRLLAHGAAAAVDHVGDTTLAVIGIVDDRLDEPDVGGGVIFDGFPRTLGQADALGALLDRHGENLDAVVEMRVDDEALVARITARSTCGSCGEVYNDITKPIPDDGKCVNCGGTEFKRRADDNAETVRTRLKAYHADTAPLIDYYAARGTLTEVDAASARVTLPADLTVRLDERDPVFIWSNGALSWLVDEEGMLFAPADEATAAAVRAAVDGEVTDEPDGGETP